MYCSSCGKENVESASFCVSCGSQLGNENHTDSSYTNAVAGERKKNPIIAMILSMLIVGLGQFYNGDNTKGVIMLLVGVIGGVLSASLIWWIAAMWSAVDAYNAASD